jgi:hypothetical protein
MSEAHVTTDHETIRRWTAERRGHPATVATTVKNGEAGVLRIDFDPEDEGLEAISWDKFFAKFDSAKLAFLYQDRVGGSAVSRFHKFVDRSSVKRRN